MDFNKACDIIRDAYGKDLLFALEGIDHQVKHKPEDVHPVVMEAYQVAMAGFREMFAPKK